MARRRNRPPGDPDLDRLAGAALNRFQRLDQRAKVAVLVLLLVVGLFAAGVVYYQRHHPASQTTPQTQGPTTETPTTASRSPHMLLGNPSGATTDPANRGNFLMLKPYYAISYNDGLGTPNWVSWRVIAADLGEAPRKQMFDSDKTLPPGFKVVTHKDYSNSGFDRGHLCPHSDRAATQAMSYATFVMTNIIPQAPNVNQRAWAQLEIYCRDLVRRGQHLYIISGPAGRGGRGSMGTAQTIAGTKVTVPAECWKIVVVIPEGNAGDDDLAKINAATRVIAVIMPNDNEAVGEAWAGFRTSPAEIEGRTGYHFFDRLPGDVAQSLRQRIDNAPIAPPQPLGHGGGGF
jgi:endonuclease G